MEGVRGSGYTGDIAIDDLQFSDGYCATIPPKADRSPGGTTPAVCSVSTSTTPASTTVPVSNSTTGSTQTSTVTGRPATRGKLIMHVSI